MLDRATLQRAGVPPAAIRGVIGVAGAGYDMADQRTAALGADPALWNSARSSAQGGPRVLMATAIGSYAHAVTLESARSASSIAASNFSAMLIPCLPSQPDDGFQALLYVRIRRRP